MSNWKFYLANSNDLSLNKDITAISRDKTISLSHNRSGNCTFNIPLDFEKLLLRKLIYKLTGKTVLFNPFSKISIQLNLLIIF